MLAALRLLERQREVAVVVIATEIGQLSQAEPNDPVGQRIGEIDVITISHRPTPGRVEHRPVHA